MIYRNQLLSRDENIQILDCSSWKGNQAPHPKFERPNGKKTKIHFKKKIGQELVRPAHLKAQ